MNRVALIASCGLTNQAHPQPVAAVVERNQRNKIKSDFERAGAPAVAVQRFVGRRCVALCKCKSRLRRHCLRTFAVITSRRIDDSPASVCHTVPGYADGRVCPVGTVNALRVVPGDKLRVAKPASAVARLEQRGPLSLSIRHNRLSAVNSGSAQYGSSKWLSCDCLSFELFTHSRSGF